jgi:hypothetical protein
MSTLVNWNGQQYLVPAYNDTGYAQGNGNLSQYLVALSTGSLQQIGGLFQLTADADFGPNFGLVSSYFKSRSANIASAGVLRLANTDAIKWRNSDNSADVTLAMNATGTTAVTYTIPNIVSSSFVMTEGNQTINGAKILTGQLFISDGDVSAPSIGFNSHPTSGIYLYGTNGVAIGVNSVISAGFSSTEAYIYLSGTARLMMYTTNAQFANKVHFPDGSASLPALTFETDPDNGIYRVGANDLGFATNGILRFDIGASTATFAIPLAMGTNKITGLAAASSNGDAVRYEQVTPKLDMASSAPFARGVKCSWSSTTSHLLWADAVLEDSSGNKVRNLDEAAIVTINWATNGVNGLDTGSLAANTWYYVWIISDGTNFKGLGSASYTSPTMPSGYTYKLLVGTNVTTAGSVMTPQIQVGKTVLYQGVHQIDSDTTNNNVRVSPDVSPWVPIPLAWEVELQVMAVGNYSAAGDKYTTICVGPHYGGAVVPKQVLEFTGYEAAQSEVTWNGWSIVFGELPTPTPIDWLVSYQTSNLTSYHTYVYVMGYKLTQLALI